MWGKNIHMKPICDGSMQKVRMPKGKKMSSSAIELYHSDDYRSKKIICNFMAKSVYTKHYFTSSFVGRQAFAMRAPVTFLAKLVPMIELSS